MKKPLSLAEQVKAARKEVESWPESVKSATEFRYSDFFASTRERAESNPVRGDNHHDNAAMLEA